MGRYYRFLCYMAVHHVYIMSRVRIVSLNGTADLLCIVFIRKSSHFAEHIYTSSEAALY